MIIDPNDKIKFVNYINKNKSFLKLRPICVHLNISYHSMMLAIAGRRDLPNSTFLKLTNFFKNFYYGEEN